MKLLFLGTGTSFGIPVVGCQCAVCLSNDPRNLRTRASAVVEIDGLHILIDAAPELRIQALRHRLHRVDALLLTHAHADHVAGLDDMRVFSILQKQVIPCFGDASTTETIRQRFSYIFADGLPWGTKPEIALNSITGRFSCSGTEIVPVPIMHGDRTILGYRIDSLAYVTDCSSIPLPSWPLLEALEVLVLDALRYKPHPTHFTVEEALEAIDKLRPKRAFLTHICHDLDHEETNRRLPEGVALAYDGLQIEI